MPNYSFTASGFRGTQTTRGIEVLKPRVNKEEACEPFFIENGRLSGDGGISGRLGFEHIATPSSKKIDTLRSQPTYSALFAKSGTKIYVGTKAQWKANTQWDIGVTRTATERDFLFPNRKDMYATNPTDSYLRIALSTADGAIASSDTSIKVKTGDIAQFAAGGGDVVINGDTIAYTGVNSGANTLTGVTGIASVHATGSIIVQTSTPTAPNGSCIGDHQNRIMVGGEEDTNPATLHFSTTYITANPEYAYDFATSPAGSKQMPSPVTCLLGGERVLMIGMKQGIAASSGFVSNALIHDMLSSTHGVPNAFCMAMMDKDFVVLTNEGRILRYGQTEAGFVLIEDPTKPQTAMDYDIQRYIRENRDDDQSLAFLFSNVDRKEVTASIIINGLSNEFVYQWDTDTWEVDTTKNHACKEYFDGEVFAGADDTSGKVYLDNMGVLDDLLPITVRITTGKFKLSGRSVTGDWLKLIMGGLLSEIGEYKFGILINDKNITGSPFTVTATDMVTKGQMDLTSSLISIGAGQFGANTIGSTGTPVAGYKFDRPVDFMDEGETCQLTFESSDFFELRSFHLEGEHEGTLLKNSS